MEEKKMFAITTDGAVLASTNFSAEELVHATLNATLGMFNASVDRAPESEKQQYKEALYDMFNASASAFLETFIPDKELRPDLTTEAIMEMENKLLDSKVTHIRDKGSAKK